MITIILIIFGWFLMVEAIKGTVSRSQKRKEARAARARQEEIDRLKALRNADEEEKERIRKQLLDHDLSIVQLQKEQIQQAEFQAKLAKAQNKLAKEQERQAEVLRQHEKRINDLEFKVQQAEAAILNEQKKLDHYAKKLSALDEQLVKIDRDIEFYQLSNKVDAEAKAWAERSKIEDKIFNFEQRVQGCEDRMSKAEHTRRQAKIELREVA